MSNRKIDRRAFLNTSARAGIVMCGVCFGARLPRVAGAEETTGAAEKIDPKKLNCCGYTCPEDCKFRQATIKDDPELKKQAWELWGIEERYGEKFDIEQAFCHGCKTTDKPEGIAVKHCTVRSCVQEKKIDCCIECDELEACEKSLWKRFPDFKKAVIEMQQQYREQG